MTYRAVLVALALAACRGDFDSDAPRSAAASTAHLPPSPEGLTVTDGYPLPVPALGPDSAPAVLAVWRDLRRLDSAALTPTLSALKSRFGDRLRVELHHFHDAIVWSAETPAVAALAAQRQGRYHEMATKLLDALPERGPNVLRRAARDIGLDVPRFEVDLTAPELFRAVHMDRQAGVAVGVDDAPALFLNGSRVEARGIAELSKRIDHELSLVDGLVRSGRPLAQVVRSRMAASDHGREYVDFVLDRRPIEVPPDPRSPYEREVDTADKTVWPIVVKPSDPSRGPPRARVTIAVCSDFQCPFCGELDEALRKVQEMWPSDVRVVFLNRPLEFHERAVPAARAAMAAHRQGRFWEMHDALFAERSDLDDSDLLRFATTIGLDLQRFLTDLEASDLHAAVDDQLARCAAQGADVTPTSFVNGRRVVGAEPVERFGPLVREALEKPRR